MDCNGLPCSSEVHLLGWLIGLPCKMKRQKLTIGSTLLFLLHQLFIALDIHFAWLDAYLDPLLFVPVTLGLTEFLIRTFFRTNFTIHLYTTLFFTGVFAFAFELVIPLKDARFTADVVDILFYFIGAFLFIRSSN